MVTRIHLHRKYPFITESVLKEQGSSSSVKNKILITNNSGQVTLTSQISKSKISDFPVLGAVATSNDYNDLNNKPNFPDLSELATVATTNNYNDLDNKPTIPTSLPPTAHEHVVGDITDFPTLAAVATSNNYNDLSNKPTIPSPNTSASNIKQNGSSANAGSSNLYARADHIHKSDNTTYTAGNGLSLSGTQFSANFGTGNTQVSRGNHTHNDKLDVNFNDPLNASSATNNQIKNFVVTGSNNDIKTNPTIDSKYIQYDGNAEGQQGIIPLNNIINDLYALINYDDSATYTFNITKSTNYIDRNLSYLYITRIGRFCFIEFAIRTLQAFPAKTASNTSNDNEHFYTTYNEIQLGTINDEQFIPESAKYFDVAHVPTNSDSYCNIRLGIFSDGRVKAMVVPQKNANSYGSGIYSFMRTYHY